MSNKFLHGKSPRKRFLLWFIKPSSISYLLAYYGSVIKFRKNYVCNVIYDFIIRYSLPTDIWPKYRQCLSQKRGFRLGKRRSRSFLQLGLRQQDRQGAANAHPVDIFVQPDVGETRINVLQ
jgi:hypothetical protein